jgi:hypothetical protein
MTARPLLRPGLGALAVLVALAGCHKAGGGSGAGGSAALSARAPARAGQVREPNKPELRANAAAELSQADGFDPARVALAWHKLTSQPLDLRSIAAQSQAVQSVSNFDRSDAIKTEVARLQAQLAAVGPAEEFVVQVNDTISEYDYDRGEFSIMLFRPGHYIPFHVFDHEYQVVFANGYAARAIPMAGEEARSFDRRLNQTGRSVGNEIHFRITGQVDPVGAVTCARVIRAEILAARLLDRDGRRLFGPVERAAKQGK